VSVYVNSGIGAQIIMTPETNYGVAPVLTSSQPYEFNNETLELKETIVQGKGLHAGGLHNRGARRVLSEYMVNGGITMDLPTRYLNQLLWQMFGSKGQTAATLTEDATTGAYSATHAPGSLYGQSMCIQKGVPSVDGTSASPFTFTGMKMLEWTLAVATGAIATLATTWDGRNALAGNSNNGDTLNATVPTLGTYTELSSNNIFHFREATLYTGGTVSTAAGITSVTSNTALGNVRSAEVKYLKKMDTTRFFLGSNGFKAEPIENDYRDITGQFVIEWLNNEAMYEAYAADTPTCLELTFVGGAIGTGSDHSGLTILIPQIFLEGDVPKVGGPAVVTQTIPFTGLDDSTNNPIQATYWTLDSV
jgi:hypothetical protein